MAHRSPKALRALFAFPLTIAIASAVLHGIGVAQVSLPLQQGDLQRIEHPRPSTPPFAGSIDIDLAVGRLVPGHPGQCVASLSGGFLGICFQPGDTRHFAAAGSLQLQRIATVPGVNGRPDRLAGLSPAGLSLLLLGPNGFERTHPLAFPEWAGLQELDVERFGSGASAATYFLGYAPGSVRLGVLDGGGGVTTLLAMPVPPTAQVLDAKLYARVPNSPPYIAALLTTGLVIVHPNGTVVQTVPGSPTAGRIAAWRDGPEPAVVVLAQQSGVWYFGTSFPDRFVNGGTMDLPRGLLGLAVAPLDNDAFPDLVVSSNDSIRRVAMSNANGPRTSYGAFLRVWDVDPADWPAADWTLDNPAKIAIADIDDNGHLDFVIAQRVTGQIVIFPAIASQLAEYAFGMLPATIDEALHFKSCQGLDNADYSGPPPTLAPAYPLSLAQGRALGLRIDLPPASSGRTLLVSRYGIVTGGAPADADPYVPTPVNYTFVIPSPHANATALDFVVPLPALNVSERYLVEIRVVDATADGFFNSTDPLFLQVITDPQMAAAGILELLGQVTASHRDGWAFDNADLSQGVFFAPAGAGQFYSPPASGERGPPYDGNRFIGAIDIPDPKKIKKSAVATVPSSSSPVPLGTAKAQ